MSMLMLNPLLPSDLFISPKLFEVAKDSSTYELFDNDEEFRLIVDVPGVKVSDLSLIVNNGVLLISWSRRSTLSGGKVNKKARFSKNFMVNQQTVDLSKLTANLADGVLVVSAPKKTRAEPQTIAITTYPAPHDGGEGTRPNRRESNGCEIKPYKRSH